MAVPKVVGADVLRAKIDILFEALNTHDVEKFVELHTRDAVFTDPGAPAPAIGKAAIRTRVTEIFTMFPDLHYPMEDTDVMFAEDGSKAVATWTVLGTMRGPAMGFAPTGKTARMTGACIYEFRGDHIARHTVIYDAMDLAQQLGLLPSVTGLPMKAFAGVQRVATRVTRLLPRR